MPQTAKSIYLRARVRAGGGWGVRGEGGTIRCADGTKIWKHTASATDLVQPLPRGRSGHHEEPVGVAVTPGRVGFDPQAHHRVRHSRLRVCGRGTTREPTPEHALRSARIDSDGLLGLVPYSRAPQLC